MPWLLLFYHRQTQSSHRLQEDMSYYRTLHRSAALMRVARKGIYGFADLYSIPVDGNPGHDARNAPGRVRLHLGQHVCRFLCIQLGDSLIHPTAAWQEVESITT